MALSNMIGGLLGKTGQSEGEGLSEKAQKFIGDKWPEIKQAYSTFHLKVWECRLFYAGELWLDRDKPNGIWRVKEPADDFTPLPNINEFAPAIDSVASNFSSVPEVEASPVPKDDENAMAVAEIANELIQHCIKDNALRSDYKSDEDKAGDAAQQFVLGGNVFSVVYPRDEKIGERPQMQDTVAYAFQCLNCDIYQGGLPQPISVCPQCGQPVLVSEQPTQTEVTDEDGRPVMEPIIGKKIIVEIGEPEHAFPRPGAKNMGKSPYFFWAERMTLEEIRSRWEIEAEADNESADGFSSNYENSLASWYLGYNNKSVQEKDSALVIQCFIESGKLRDYPEGLHAVYVNGKVQRAETWPFAEHPFTKADYLGLPTVFFARSISFDLAELQKELNRYESILALHGMTSAADSIVADENSKVSEITGRCDKVIWWRAYAPGVKEPHRMQHGSLDEGIYRKREQILESMQRVSASVAVWRGEQPGSITAASAIAQLRGQAELQFSKPTQNWNNFWKETIRKVIRNYQRFFTLEQLVEICGQEKVTQVQLFIQANLDKCLDYIATSSGLPKTCDERRQEMMLLYDKGALDINDPKVKEKLFELFGETGMFATFNDDARRARLNINKIKAGEPALFRPGIDDPTVHLGIALESAKSLDYDRWPPPVQQALILYIQNIQGIIAAMAPPPEEEEGKPKEGGEKV